MFVFRLSKKRFKTPFRRSLRHDDGVVAVEFALVLPVMLLILLGVIELTNAMMTQRKLLNAVQTTADLIGQQTSITAGDLSNIYYAAQLTLSPLDTSKLSIGVASVRFESPSGNPVLDWTSSHNGGGVYDPITKATGRGDAGESVIIVVASYVYSPIITMIIPADITMSELSFMRPRTTDYIMLY